MDCRGNSASPPTRRTPDGARDFVPVGWAVLPSRHRILLIEDDCDQQFLATHALRKAASERVSINVTTTGNEAIAYMIGEGKFADRERFPFPTIVITDLNMHDGDGFEVLEFMRVNPAWCIVPRIVFTSSEHDEDIRTAYQLGASAYHVKSNSLGETERQMAQIISYWSTIHVPATDHTGRIERTSPFSRLSHRYPPIDGGAHMERPHDHVDSRS